MSDSTFELQGHSIRVSEGPYLVDGQATEAAREFAKELIKMFDEMRQFAAKERLALYNEQWREDEDPVLSEEEFAGQLTDPAIVLYDELGAACVYFGDSDMFDGHSIEVSVDQGKIAYTTMVG